MASARGSLQLPSTVHPLPSSVLVRLMHPRPSGIFAPSLAALELCPRFWSRIWHLYRMHKLPSWKTPPLTRSATSWDTIAHQSHVVSGCHLPFFFLLSTHDLFLLSPVNQVLMLWRNSTLPTAEDSMSSGRRRPPGSMRKLYPTAQGMPILPGWPAASRGEEVPAKL